MGIISGVGASGTVSSANGGKVYSLNSLNAVTASVLAPPNPQRMQILFHNPGVVDILVFPQFAINYQTGVGINNPATVAAPGGGFIVFANGGSLTLTGECQVAWYGFAVSGAAGALTVMDSNV